MLGITGLCGSGIIEAIAELFIAGVIDVDGVIRGALSERTDRVQPDGRTYAYVLYQDDQRRLAVTQNDIRAIQLAKAALYASTKLLLDRLEGARVERIRLAGAFGSHIDVRHAMILGMIPDCDLDRVEAVGNAAGRGACLALLSGAARRHIESLVQRIERIETATEPRFQEHFMNAIALPNKADAFPHLSTRVTLPEATAAAPGRKRRRRSRGRVAG